LPRRLRTGDIVLRVFITALLAEHGVPVAGRYGIRKSRLTAEAVAAVFRFPVDGVASDAVGIGILQYGDTALIF
jgi:hypothetical protein